MKEMKLGLEIKGEVVDRFMMRGKMVVIARIDDDNGSFYMFKIDDKCNKKDYYSNDRYETKDICERNAKRICKAV